MEVRNCSTDDYIKQLNHLPLLPLFVCLFIFFSRKKEILVRYDSRNIIHKHVHLKKDNNNACFLKGRYGFSNISDSVYSRYLL